MNKRRMYTIGLTVLLLGVMFTTYGVWTQSSFSHGEPGFDEGCYCHNNGIAVFVNGTGDGNGGVFLGSVKAGASFHLRITTNSTHATGVVPGLQLWESNQTDNAKFTFNPTEVTATSPQNLSPIAGNITAVYKIIAPTTNGVYTLTLYAQGTLLQPIEIQVTGGTTSTTSSTSSQSTTSTTTPTTSTKSTTTTTSTTGSSTTQSSSASTGSITSSTASTQSTTATKSITSTSTITTPSGSVYSIGVGTNVQNYSATTAITIYGLVSPAPGLRTAVEIQVVNPDYTTVAFNDNVTVAASGAFSYTVSIVANSTGWVYGTYTVTVMSQEPAPMMVTSQFFYTPHAVTISSTSTVTTVTTTSVFTRVSLQTTTQTATTTATVTSTTGSTTITATSTKTVPTTVTNTATLPPTTVTSTAPPTTITNTQTATLTSTSTVTKATSTIPDWAYGVMVVLLLIGLAIGYVVTRPSVKQK